MTLDEVVQDHILKTLEECRYNKSEAARRLGINVKTVREHLNRIGWKMPKPSEPSEPSEPVMPTSEEVEPVEYDVRGQVYMPTNEERIEHLDDNRQPRRKHRALYQ